MAPTRSASGRAAAREGRWYCQLSWRWIGVHGDNYVKTVSEKAEISDCGITMPPSSKRVAGRALYTCPIHRRAATTRRVRRPAPRVGACGRTNITQKTSFMFQQQHAAASPVGRLPWAQHAPRRVCLPCRCASAAAGGGRACAVPPARVARVARRRPRGLALVKGMWSARGPPHAQRCAQEHHARASRHATLRDLASATATSRWHLGGISVASRWHLGGVSSRHAERLGVGDELGAHAVGEGEVELADLLPQGQHVLP